MLLSPKTTSQTINKIDLFNNVGIALWLEDASLLFIELNRIQKKHGIPITKYIEQYPHEVPRLIDLIKILDVNDEAVKMYKAEHKDQLISGIRNFFIKESYHDFTKMMIGLFSGNSQYSYTSSKITITGYKIVSQVTVRITKNAENDWSEMIVSEIEISNFVKREVSLKIQTEKAIQEADNKEKLVSIIAHDLKNPFNTILGFSELLLTKYDSISKEQAIDFIKYIHESANQSYHLLTNLLHWSKMQQSPITKSMQVFKLHDTVEPICTFLHTSCISKNITIHSNIDKEITIYADVHMLSFVIRNLLTNAIKFSYKYSNIYITAIQQDSMVKIDISDTGTGMDTNLQGNLFNPHFDSIRNGTENEQGTGIGLMLCKEFIEKQKGRLEITSELGNGTNVSIFLLKEKKQYLP